MLDSRASKWQFWLLWVLASTLGGSVVSTVVRAAAYAVGYAVIDVAGSVLGEAALGAVALGGVLGAIAIAQWLVMLRQIPWAGWWLLASFLSGAAGGAVMLASFAALSGAGEALAGIAGVVMGLATFAAAQWLVLRRQVSWAGWLVLASVAGLVAAGPLGAGLIGALIGSELGSGLGFGAAYGAVTGGAMVILFSRAATAAGVAEAV